MQKSLADVHPVLREMLCVHQVLRQLGFHPDDIHVGNEDDGTSVIILRAQGKEFVIYCGRTPQWSEEEFERRWTEVTEGWNAKQYTDQEFRRIYEASAVYRNRQSFLMALTTKGFRWPRSQN